MARGRAAWKRALDPKKGAQALFTGLERAAPALTGALGYHSLRAWPADAKPHDRGFIAKMAEPPYRASYEALREHSVDPPFRYYPAFEAHFVDALIPDVLLPGHTLLPVDHRTGQVISWFEQAPLPWGFAWPMPAFNTTRLAGISFAIPRMKNYYHLTIDYLLPAIETLIRRQAEWAGREVNLVVFDDLPVTRYFMAVVADHGYRPRLVRSRPGQAFACETYLYAQVMGASHDHSFCFGDFTGEIGRQALGRGPSPAGEKLYIPRTRTRIRNLHNEPDVRAALQARGFSVLKLGWDDFESQVRAFAGAKLVVAAHGAALANLMWAQPPCRVIELQPFNARKSVYLHFAAERGLDYDFVLGGEEDARQDFAVDIPALLAKLT